MKMTVGLEHLSSEKKTERDGSVQPGEEKAWYRHYEPLYCADDVPLAQDSQRGCEVSLLGDIQKSFGLLLGNLLWVALFKQQVGPEDL